MYREGNASYLFTPKSRVLSCDVACGTFLLSILGARKGEGGQLRVAASKVGGTYCETLS